jgi:two-component system chemotaxis response regulator CheY
MSKKILVVDDNADMREMLQIYLVSCGFTVMLAGDGNEGIEAAKTHSPDLIVTDASMPRVGGLEMTTRLRALPEFTNTPIIVVTGSVVEDEAVRAGPTLVLLKPVLPISLAAKINEILGSDYWPTQG